MCSVAKIARAMALAVAIWSSSLVARADLLYFGHDIVLSTGGGTSMATTNFTLAADPLWTGFRLQLGFGFATDETNSAAVFLDSFSLTLQTLDAASTFLLLTTDVNGMNWAPNNPGGLPVSPDLILREPHSPGNTASGYAAAWSYAVSVAIPSAFAGTTSQLFLDLFDNQNALGSVGWLSYARIVPDFPINTTPILIVQDQIADEHAPLVFTIDAFDTDVPANQIVFDLVAGPAGLTVNTNNGVVNWTPTEAQGPGTNTVTVKVTDSGTPALSVTQSFQVVVREVNTAPALGPLASHRAQTGRELSFTVSATDSDIPVQSLRLSLEAGSPAGATITAEGLFRWIPGAGQTGVYDIAVTVTDSGVPEQSTPAQLHVTVSDIGNLRLQTAGADFFFRDATNAVIDILGQTVWIPVTQSLALYRLKNDRPTRITGLRIFDGQALLSYAVEPRNVKLEYAPRLNAKFEIDPEAIVDEATQTIRTSYQSYVRFYRVVADLTTRILGICVENDRLVIRYEQIGEMAP